MLRDRLVDAGYPVELLDSGKIRRALEKRLGFTSEDIEQNIRRIAYECQLLNRNGVVAIVVAISPYKAQRENIRQTIPEFVEVHCDAPLDVLEKRDTAGMLAQARRGELTNVAGVNAPYEAPEDPEAYLPTHELNAVQCVDRLIAVLQQRKLMVELPPSAYTPREHRMIKSRLKDMGY
jgi:adenylylsulfate kinase